MFESLKKLVGTPDVRKERRTAGRFPITRELTYKVLNGRSHSVVGIGRSINISSRGILLSIDRTLAPGRRVEISVSWPAQLNEQCALKLVAFGTVLRYDQGKAAVLIRQYEFRTQPLHAMLET